MVKVVAQNTLVPEKVDEAINLYQELVAKTRQENGCIKYELFQDVKDPAILTVIEEWESQEALDLHMKTEHFTRIVPMVNEFKVTSNLNIYKKVI